MKTNPGGQLAPNDVIGRDRLIDDLWGILETQSIIMTAERRIGKTSVMNKLVDAPKDNWLPILRDLENCHSAMDFATSVSHITRAYLSLPKKTTSTIASIRQHFKSFTIGSAGVELTNPKTATWEHILETAIRDLDDEQAQHHHQIVFLLDEIPYMLGNIKKQESEATAKKVLDTLRYLRNTYPHFRILMTGSIGLHHVLSELKEDGYHNQPINDMYQVEVQPLESRYAQQLADLLLKGEGLNSSGSVAETIAKETDNFPFYIHHVVRGLKNSYRNKTITPDDVRQMINHHLTDSNDPWQLRHYLERIPAYYGGHAEVVKLVLDELATSDNPQAPKDLFQRLQSQSNQLPDAETIRQLLTHMAQDHYVIKDANGKYNFRFSLIQRWWKLERELA